MAKTWDEKLSSLSAKLNDLSKKAEEAAGDAKAYRELREEVIQDKIATVKGNVAAIQENARLTEEERQGKIRSEILRLRMTAKAKAEDFKDARDKKRYEKFIDGRLAYVLDCYDAAALLIIDAELSILEAAEALRQYDARFGADAEPETEAETETKAE